jgi:hypothetical protein
MRLRGFMVNTFAPLHVSRISLLKLVQNRRFLLLLKDQLIIVEGQCVDAVTIGFFRVSISTILKLETV